MEPVSTCLVIINCLAIARDVTYDEASELASPVSSAIAKTLRAAELEGIEVSVKIVRPTEAAR